MNPMSLSPISVGLAPLDSVIDSDERKGLSSCESRCVTV